MIGTQKRWQEDLFVAGPLSEVIPDDHILKQVDRILDLSWLRDEVRDLYCEDNGRPSIDPETALRLMLAGLFQNITKDRKLMREGQVNLAIRWFAGYRLHENLPHHSALSKIRRRWGEETFRLIFDRTVKQCLEAGLIQGDTVHIDATLIRADVSWESVVERHVDRVISENEEEHEKEKDHDDKDDRPPESSKSRTKKPKKYSPTDPEATLTTSHKSSRMEPSYKQHTAVDGKSGIIVDVQVTTGEVNEGNQLLEQIEQVEQRLERHMETVTADAGYGHASNYGQLEQRKTEAIIPPQRRGRKSRTIPLAQFKYDQHHDLVRCPEGKILKRTTRVIRGYLYRARKNDCASCRLRTGCLSSTVKTRTVVIGDAYPALLRARRRSKHRDERWWRLYSSHKSKVEGIHGESKSQHGLHRAARRGRWNVSIQSSMTATVINLKRLAKAKGSLCHDLLRLLRRIVGYSSLHQIFNRQTEQFAAA